MTIRALSALLALSTAAAAQVVFEPRVDMPLLTEVFDAAVGDVDGDGDLDVVVGLDPLQLLVNDGSGAFTPQATSVSGESVYLQLVDLDGDGHLDLVRSIDEDVEVALGLGDGTFGPVGPSVMTLTNIPTRLLAEDMTNDGIPDVVVASGRFVAGEMDVRLGVGAGDGSIASEVVIQGVDGTFVPTALDVGDLDGDTFPDVVIALTALPFTTIRVLRSNGGTSFTTFDTIGVGPADTVFDVRLDDVTGDGIDDLVVLGSFGLFTKRGLGSGTFGPAKLHVTDDVSFGSNLAVADVDEDGLVDLSFVANKELVVLRGTGGNDFDQAATLTGTRSARAFAAAHLDGDDRLDVGFISFDGSKLDTYTTVRNRTYGPDEPWTDVGQGLSNIALDGAPARPVLIAEGTLAADDPVTLELHRNNAPQDTGFLVVGFSQLEAPLKGGVLVPSPDLLVGPLLLPTDGALELTAPFPAGVPSATELVFQTWLPADAQATFSASSGVVGVTP